jgi:hypothetical protein
MQKRAKNASKQKINKQKWEFGVRNGSFVDEFREQKINKCANFCGMYLFE